MLYFPKVLGNMKELKSMKVSDKFLYNFSYHLLLPLARCLFKFEIIEQNNIPNETGVLIMSNHLSYLDPPFMGLAVGFAGRRELNFMARKSLFKNKFFGTLIRELNAFPVERGKADRTALKKALSLVKQGKAVLMFPEGTRGMNDKLGEPHQGAGFIAYWANCPVIPAYIKGTEIALPRDARKIRLAKVVVVFGKPIDMNKFKDISTKRRKLYPLIAQEIIDKIAMLKKDIDERSDT